MLGLSGSLAGAFRSHIVRTIFKITVLMAGIATMVNKNTMTICTKFI